ncbi:MAG: ABC transporter ATP-binding protein [Firmicutes bacterium]|nr:ABC transporter ATP-binding protein [Bacillota bacterium]
MLELEGIDVFYGPSHVLHALTAHVEEGEVLALLGRSGAGKTTTLKTVMGWLRPRAGRIRWRGQDISHWESVRIARLGFAMVAQGRRVFPSLSVAENLGIALNPTSPWSLEDVYQLFPRLEERRYQAANTLSGGEQQMLSLGRALVRGPRVLLLDEPTEGMAPAIVQLTHQVVEMLREAGITVVLVEQNLAFALSLAARVAVMNKGQVVYEGRAQEFAAHRELQVQYLGVSTTGLRVGS